MADDEFQYNNNGAWQENDEDIDLNASYACTSWAPAVGFAGITCAVVFASKFVDVVVVVVVVPP